MKDTNDNATSLSKADGNTLGLASIEEAFGRLENERPGVLASEAGGELAWMKKARKRDAERWKSEGLPVPAKNERWKYTNVAPISKSHIVLPSRQSKTATPTLPPNTKAIASILNEAATLLVFVDGRFESKLSKIAKESVGGVEVSVLSNVLQDCVEQGWSNERMSKFAAFKEEVETSDADRENVFASMNTSFMEDAVLVSIAPGKMSEKPIVVRYLSTGTAVSSADELAMTSPRVFIHAARGSMGTLLEIHEGVEGARYFSNAVTDLRLEEGARLAHCKIQLESHSASHIGTTRIHQKRDSNSESIQISLGAALCRQDLHISLEGENAESTLSGLYAVDAKRHVDHFTSVDHVVPHTQSDQIYKGVLSGESRGVFNGRVKIHRDAQKSNAGQLNTALILGTKAEVDTKPELDINADDVKASHGAAIGRIDPEHVFYLKTRAIPEETAVRMLALGYALDVADRVQNSQLRGLLRALIEERLVIPQGVMRG